MTDTTPGENTAASQTPSDKKSSSTMMGIAVVVVILVLAGVLVVSNRPDSSSSPTTPTTATQDSGSGAMVEAGDQIEAYNPGTYTSTGTYTSPGGPEEIDVTLTIDATGRVEDSQVVVLAENPASIRWQTEFRDFHQDQVLGADIDSLQVEKVAGSSLTPKGFNNALEDIKAQARI